MSCLIHMEQGDGAECLRDLRAHLALAQHLDAAYPSVIQMLVRLAIEAQAVDIIERAVNRTVFDADTITLLESELREIETTPDLQRAFMRERVMFLDAFDWAKTRGAFNIASPGTSNPLKYIPVLPSLDVSTGIRLYSQLIAGAEKPSSEALSASMAVEAERGSLPRYHLLTNLILPSFTRSIELWLRGIGSKRALIAALACERYRLANGEWPESLTDLVPEYLKAVPVDPFDGAPIRYAITSQGIELWCIGEDLKDDGGDIKRRDKKGPKDRPTDWGWLILNPDLRGKPLPDPASATTTSSPATQSAGN